MYMFKQKVSLYCSEGVNFREYSYVPEVSKCTGEPQHERDDYGFGKDQAQTWGSSEQTLPVVLSLLKT